MKEQKHQRVRRLTISKDVSNIIQLRDLVNHTFEEVSLMMKNIEAELIEKYAKGQNKVRCKFILKEDVRSNTYICAVVEYPESDKEIVARVNEERRAAREIEQHKKKNETNLKRAEKEEKKLKLLPLTGGGDYAEVSDRDIIEVEEDEDEFSDDHVIHKGSGGWHV
jgi:hypothetical protein